MKTIWKFHLPLEDRVEVMARKGARPIHVGTDPTGVRSVWMEVNPDEDIEKPVVLYIVGTGHPLPDIAFAVHVGSLVEGPFVWHVYWSGAE